MKKIISFVVRHIPRKYLQLFSHIALKVVAVFYRGNQVACPVCDSQFSKFVPYGRVARANALCPNCLALERHRLMWLYLQRKTNFFQPGQEVLHIAPELCFIKRFEKIHRDQYITADLESPLAKVKMDIHEMPFEDNRFDVAFCNHVMEHVADDIQSMKEIYRVLKPGGWAIIQIPIFHPVPEVTFEDDTVTDPKEREKLFGQDDHVRLYGKDYPDRLRQAGFTVVEDDFVSTLSTEEQVKYALPKDEMIHLCKKI
ncbi:methyltransferase domain-containing protein [Reichenbachiella carrageenanivorans]|uniref:Methyltransferase domain-containing protein n=1 Tax=Reichenbachiella carrageenanivorans TaxID=2979869 RepID=A0ABY6D1P7_9BACT|nr:class I SAM-dependent methyltransferase [Reichenbachiella carrageenanivorans]UXX79654.1 methyltransferase domain-containing protein [Reichenbachiella carrageenanivorans]